MASYFLLLFFLFTTTASTTISPPPPPPLHHSPPPPQNPPSTKQETHFNSIIHALTQTHHDFKNWAHFLSHSLNPSILPLSATATATLFVPNDGALTAGVNLTDPLLFPYHIVPRRYSFNSLRHFQNRARIPTLLSGFSLLITNHSTTNFTINSARIIRPNLYLNALVSVHGINSILDYTLFGKDPPSSSPSPSPSLMPPKYDAGEDDISDDRHEVDPPVYNEVNTSASPESNGLYFLALIVYWCTLLCGFFMLGFAVGVEMSKRESRLAVILMVGIILLRLLSENQGNR